MLGSCSVDSQDEPQINERWYTQAQVDNGRTLFATPCANRDFMTDDWDIDSHTVDL